MLRYRDALSLTAENQQRDYKDPAIKHISLLLGSKTLADLKGN
jgi:hypothetical protein